MNQRRILTLCLVLIGICSTSYAQEFIKNAGFEGKKGEAKIPKKWNACSKSTTPDILPGEFDVDLVASEGDTYVGLITRDNGDLETIGQKLKFTLLKGQCYEFTMDVARSETYAGYNIPVGLKIWISTSSCTSEQLIFHSKSIESNSWEEVKVRFTPNSDMSFIRISPVSVSGLYFNYKGNILIDNISVLNTCSRS